MNILISSTDKIVALPLKSWIINRPTFIGNLASNLVNDVILLVSRAIDALKIFADVLGSIAD